MPTAAMKPRLAGLPVQRGAQIIRGSSASGPNATLPRRARSAQSYGTVATRLSTSSLAAIPASRTAIKPITCLSTSRRHSTQSAPPAPSVTVPDIPPEDSYDIVIIGGANAGLALACALLTKPSIRQTTRILLLEGGSLDRVRNWDDRGEWENRVSSLTAENVNWLKSIGAWKHIAQHRPCEVEEMVIWANPDPSSSPSIHFSPLGHPMAYMTENTNLQRALLRRIDELNPGTFTLHEGPSARVSSMHPDPAGGGRWVGLCLGSDASTGSPKWVRGGVVVGADGPNSPVRKYSDIESFGHSYDTHGVVATLKHAKSPLYPNNTAFQRFLPTGPLAWLPLDEESSTMVWSTRPDHAAAYKRLDPEALVEVVNAGYTLPEQTLEQLNEAVLLADASGSGAPLSASAIRSLLSTLPIPSNTAEPAILPPAVRSIPPRSVASFPLRLSHAAEYLGAPGTRTVLVGDAAHTTHPLAGQGLNMGLADVRALADAWETARSVGGDLGSVTSMAPYPRVQYPANQLLLSTVDVLHHVFRNRSQVGNWVRGMGLDVINELGPVKRLLMQGAGAVPSQGARQGPGGHGVKGGEDGKRGRGWPYAAASGLEGWLGAKKVLGQAVGMAGQVVAQTIARAGSPSSRKGLGRD